MYMNLKSKMLKAISLSVVILSFFACENDVSEIGSGMVDNNNFNNLLYSETSISAISKKIEKVQTNGQSSLNMGVYKDPVFGVTKTDFISQLTLSKTNPSFGDEPIVDSVVLTLPYFSTPTGIDDNGENVYKLDSVYKFGLGQINFSVYRTNYFLRSEDPDNDFKPQVYYSNQYDLFNQQKESQPLAQVTNFTPSAVRKVIYQIKEGELDTVSKTPRLRVHLSKEYFQQHIIEKEGSNELLSNDNFQNYFRGIHIQAEKLTSNDGVLSLFDLSSEDAGITIYYNVETKPAGGAPQNSDDKYLKSFQMKFSGNMFNVENTEEQSIPQDDKLYLKGGQGAMAIIDVFQDEEELANLRSKDWLINEANLTFYVDESQVAADEATQPKRLFLYDVNNNAVLYDYSMDPTANKAFPIASRIIHLEPLSKTKEGLRKYKLRLTAYVNDILKKDSTNTKLGLVVSQNVNVSTMSEVALEGNEEAIKIPSATVLSRQGTVLYGTEASEEKRLKLDIYYTEAK